MLGQQRAEIVDCRGHVPVGTLVVALDGDKGVGRRRPGRTRGALPPAPAAGVDLAGFVGEHHLPGLGVPSFGTDEGHVPGFFEAYGTWMGTPPASWDDIAWLREQWDGPFMVKGIGRGDEAKRAVDAGATAISVSNHGGNNIDGSPAPIRVLPEIVDAVGSQIEVLMDGGIRRGSDVVKALALGARAVLIGRAYLWGLAANGQGGVENVLDILRDGMDATLRGLGKSSIGELPNGFSKTPRQIPNRSISWTTPAI